jgi:hypothetical protein
LEVPEKSAQWARTYVGQWIMKDRAAGISVCPTRSAGDRPLEGGEVGGVSQTSPGAGL